MKFAIKVIYSGQERNPAKNAMTPIYQTSTYGKENSGKLNQEIASKQMMDFVRIDGFKNVDLQRTFPLASRFKLFTLFKSLGGVESLVHHPVTMTLASIHKKFVKL